MVKAEAGFSELTRGSGLPTCEPLSLVLTRGRRGARYRVTGVCLARPVPGRAQLAPAATQDRALSSEEGLCCPGVGSWRGSARSAAASDFRSSEILQARRADGRASGSHQTRVYANALHCGSRAHEVKAITEGLFEAKAANWRTERSSI